MTTPSERQCPLHRHPSPKASSARSPAAWPPGPAPGLTGWHLLIAMSRDLPGMLARWQKAHGDIVHLRIWPEHDVVVADPQLARELLVTHHDALMRWERAISVFSQVHGQSVLTTEGESWRTRRHALAPNFAPKAVQGFSPTIVEASAQALAQWPSAHDHWPVESALTALAMDAILRMAFSCSVDEDLHAVEQAIRVTSAAANAEFFWPASMPDWMPWKRAKRKALGTLKDMIERHLQRRLSLARDAWPDDLLTRFLQAREAAPALSLDDVRDECMTLFLAGHETTAATLVWWTWCMASNPEAQRMARDEVRRVLQGRDPTLDALPALGYLTQTIKETMRRYPVAPLLISRRSRHAIQLGQWAFPARTLFMIPVQLMHHDARWFPDPDAFRPERFAHDAPEIPRGAYMPFGSGPRVCIGQHLAMAEMTVIAAMLLQRFAFAVPAGAAAPRPVLRVTLRPDEPMHLAIRRIDPEAAS
ncbi:cytochrome P450 [Burkholderia sp. Ac-20379]|uniref:cytochrome P450 n=1 Tax=Burkholderia sp. Ac-20379 TaxID=2703900 RepID=UPI00197EB3B7|nr:cytochrome P450 [Burkholderia sp. Ac-20379]MBN3722597.1 cytochrome P450 [Burkholderia sp. Ac-20379]